MLWQVAGCKTSVLLSRKMLKFLLGVKGQSVTTCKGHVKLSRTPTEPVLVQSTFSVCANPLCNTSFPQDNRVLQKALQHSQIRATQGDTLSELSKRPLVYRGSGSQEYCRQPTAV